MKATSIAFERRYSDDSGIEYAVRLKGGVEIELEAVDKISFPATELDWLIAALERIRDELAVGKPQGEQPCS